MSSTGATTLAPRSQTRLRWAVLADVPGLCELFACARPERRCEEVEMASWLEHGGAVIVESDGRTLAAVRWREEGDGWRVDPVAALPEERDQGYDRWLMTKVEAHAIRSNIPTLVVELPAPEALPYYRRLGYRRRASDPDDRTLVKRVGGTWQVQEEAR